MLAANKTEYRHSLERELVLRRELARRRGKAKAARKTIIGFVCPDKGFTHAIQWCNGVWVETIEEPDVYLAAVMERVVKSTKRFIVLIGGRGSSKSVCVADIGLIAAKDHQDKAYCLREYQSSIKNSIQSLLTDEAARLEFTGFEAKGSSLEYNGEELFQFEGLARNVDSIRSAHGFKRFLIEESQFISHASLQALTPTARNKPNKGLPRKVVETEKDTGSGVSIIFIANPRSSADPFSQRFVQPFLKDIMAKGYYEDDLHLVVMVNYYDNPWFMESGLEAERLFDKKNKATSEYEHIWEGAFNDDVDNNIITVIEFDAAIDAHKTLGFKGSGALIASHDPSDLGPDAKGYSLRHGSVVLKVCKNDEGDVNDGMDWALDMAIADGADLFIWDADGLGIGLKRQVDAALAGKKMTYELFRGGETPKNPDAVYIPSTALDGKSSKTNKDTFLNCRAQHYIRLADRFKNTYRAIVKGEYVDPDIMISLDSGGIEDMAELRAEVCRIPLKKGNGNGKIQIMSKIDMAAPPLRIPSPNLADALMMGQTIPPTVKAVVQMPQPIKRIRTR